MNNFLMFDIKEAGGVPYNETERYEYCRYYTTDGLTDTSEYKTIRFSVNQENIFCHWKNAFLELRGHLKPKTGEPKTFDKKAKIAFIMNAIPHMFSNAKLTLGSRVIEAINNVGHVSSLMHYTLLARSKMKCNGLSFLWAPDTENTTADANKGFLLRRDFILDRPKTPGFFSLRIPLSMIFGFMENFVIMRGYPVAIELVRGADHSALFRADTGVVEGKIEFEKLMLNVPIVEPSNTVTVETLRGLSDPKNYLYSFRRRSGLSAPIPSKILEHQMTVVTTTMVERPQVLWIAFQKDMTSDQKTNNAIYWHGNVQQMTMEVNNVQFPISPVSADFDENDPGMFYTMSQQVRENYLQISDAYTEGNMLNPPNFVDLFPVYVLDVSKQNFTVGAKSVSTKLNVRFKTATPENMIVHIAWYSDRTLELATDGSCLNIKENVDSFISNSA